MRDIGSPGAKQKPVPNTNIAKYGVTTPATPGVGTATVTPLSTNTSAAFLQVALDLVKKNPNISWPTGPHPSSPISDPTPNVLDDATFIQWCYYKTTSKKDMPSTANGIRAKCKMSTKIADGLNTNGALMFTGRHVMISLGNGNQVVGAQGQHKVAAVIDSKYTPATKAKIISITTGAISKGTPAKGINWDGWGQFSGMTYVASQGTSPAATAPTGGNTAAAGAAAGQAANTTYLNTSPALAPTVKGGNTPKNSKDPLDALFSTLDWEPIYDQEGADLAVTLKGKRALLNDSPLLPYIANLFNITMRSYCSAPNGDLMAWFPDYYGDFGTAAIMTIEPIELKEFNVDWSDDYLVTHQYCQQAVSVSFQQSAGTLDDTATQDAQQSFVVSVEDPSVMKALFGFSGTDQEVKNIGEFYMKRFGARPDTKSPVGLAGAGAGYKQEFFLTLFYFQRAWAFQYNADVQLTFMPELWPGMLIQIPRVSFQAYITTVTHSFSLGEGGSFRTTINIAAPANMGSNNKFDTRMTGLPKSFAAGDLGNDTKLLGPGKKATAPAKKPPTPAPAKPAPAKPGGKTNPIPQKPTPPPAPLFPVHPFGTPPKPTTPSTAADFNPLNALKPDPNFVDFLGRGLI